MNVVYISQNLKGSMICFRKYHWQVYKGIDFMKTVDFKLQGVRDEGYWVCELLTK